MRKLPTEVYAAIFECLVDPNALRDLVSVCFCCRFFYDVAAPILYRDLRVDQWPSPRRRKSSWQHGVMPFLRTLVLSGPEGLASHARALLFRGSVISAEGTPHYVDEGEKNDRRPRFQTNAEKRGECWEEWQKSGLVDFLELAMRDEDNLDAGGVYGATVEGRKSFRDDYNRVFQAALRNCNNLKRLRIDITLEPNTSTIAAISSLPLESFDMRFSETMEYFWGATPTFYHEGAGKDDLKENFRMRPVPGYSDLSLSPLAGLSGTLKKLNIFDLSGDMCRLVGDLADVLIACRATLETLGLGLAYSIEESCIGLDADTVRKYDESEPGCEPKVADKNRPDRSFWTKLCCRFARRTAHLHTMPGPDPRLKIRNLNLEHGLIMTRRGSDPFPDEDREFLSLAFNLSYLESLIWRVGMGDGDAALQNSGWDRFGPATGLKEIGVELLSTRLEEFLTERKGTIEKLEVYYEINHFRTHTAEADLNRFYDVIASAGLRSLRCEPIGLTGLWSLAAACANLEELVTRTFDVAWREVLDATSNMPRLQSFTVSIGLDIVYQLPDSDPEDDAGDPPPVRREDRLTDGICTFGILDRWRSYLKQGKWQHMRELNINGKGVGTGRWWLVRKDRGGAAAPRWQEPVGLRPNTWVDIDLTDPEVHVKRAPPSYGRKNLR